MKHLFSFLFKKKIVLKDPVFGKMIYHDIKDNPSANYFECNPFFNPLGKSIEAAIEADPTGPSQEQILLFQKIGQNYPYILEKAVPLIEKELQNWKPDLHIKDFSKEFTLVFLEIPRVTGFKKEWILDFCTIHDEDRQIELTMFDLEVQSVFIDG